MDTQDWKFAALLGTIILIGATLLSTMLLQTR